MKKSLIGGILAVASITTLTACGTSTGTASTPSGGASPAASVPVLRANDATCGSRLELRTGDGKVYALMLDGERDFRVLDITEESQRPGGGCSLGRTVPDAPKSEDSTGAQSARIRSGWDTQLNRCSQYTVIDGRRWILDDPNAAGYLAHGGHGRIVAGDPRCGGELPMQPYGGAACPDHGPGWRYGWDAAVGQCVANVAPERQGEPQGR